VLALATTSLPACCRGDSRATAQPLVCPRPEHASTATQRFLSENASRYREAIARARGWLDGLQVDPAELRAAGIKGKKKLVEYLDAYVRLHAIAPLPERPAVLERVRQIVAVTYTPAYHDMATINDKHFKQDSTSYLRAAFLMEGLGLDTTLYRREIRKIHGRLDGHMHRRGPNQRMVFHGYYAHFGLNEPFDLASAFQDGVIAARLAPHEYRNRNKAYDLTHEVFVPYEYGEKLDARYFDGDDLAYLRRTLDVVTSYYLVMRNPDLVAEFVSCMRYLRMTDIPVYRTALEYLLTSQHADGRWGNFEKYEKYRKPYGRFVDQGWYLHTTVVALDALTIAFHFPDQDQVDGRGSPRVETKR
jgi:hypothetical protein